MENKVLAKVNGKEITALDVDTFIRNLGPQRGAQYNNDQGKQQILDELINQNLFLADGLENKLEDTEAGKRELERMKEVVLTQLNVNQTLGSVGIEPGEIADYFAVNKARQKSSAKLGDSGLLRKASSNSLSASGRFFFCRYCLPRILE